MAGVSRLQYKNEIRLVRVMCSGRVDLEFVLRAFLDGMDGVFLGACRLNECNYITHGNYHALAMVLLCKKIMENIGLDPHRLRIEFMSSGEGNIFTEVVDDFIMQVEKLGPLGRVEKMDENELKLKLQTAVKLVPYIKLVEGERFRIGAMSENAYRDFYSSDEASRLFEELIADKLAISQILALLREKPLSTGEISRILSMSPSEISRHMTSSSRQGLVRYDVERKRYALV